MRTRRSAFLLPALLSALTVAVVACNGESEGQPCDIYSGFNGSDPPGTNDCQSPLKCTKAPNPSTDGYRCCPADLSQATTPECTTASVYIDASPAPPEASVDGAAPGPDAPVESAAETGPSADAQEGAAPTDAADGGAG